MPASILRNSIAILASILALGLVSQPASASRARRDGLTGNFALEDPTDVYVFPGLLDTYDYQFDLDIADRVTGAMILRPSSSYVTGVAVNRSQPLNNLDGIDDLGVFKKLYGAGYANVPTSELGTFLLGLESGLGFRLSITSAQKMTEVKSANATVADGYSVTGVEPSAGYSWRGGGTEFDLAATLRLNSGVVKVNDKEIGSTEGPPSFMLASRFFFGDATDWLRVSLLADLSYHNYSIKDEEAGAFVAHAGAGPTIRVGDRVRLAALASLGLATLSQDPEGAAKSDSLAFAFPGFDMSAEYRLRSWLDLRWGYQGRFLIQSSTDERGKNNSTSLTTTNAETTWSAGLGLRSWDFGFDVGVQTTQSPGASAVDAAVFSISYRPSKEHLERVPPSLEVPNDPFAPEHVADAAATVSPQSPTTVSPQSTAAASASEPPSPPSPPPSSAPVAAGPEVTHPTPNALTRAEELLAKATAAELDLTSPLDFALADQKVVAARAAKKAGRLADAEALAQEAIGLLAPLVEGR